MIHNPHAVTRLAKVQSVSPMRRPSIVNPIVLTPITWGKPDRSLASVVRNSVGCATPATVIPWAPGQGGLRRRLRSMRVHTDIDDTPISHVHRFVSVEELGK